MSGGGGDVAARAVGAGGGDVGGGTDAGGDVGGGTDAGDPRTTAARVGSSPRIESAGAAAACCFDALGEKQAGSFLLGEAGAAASPPPPSAAADVDALLPIFWRTTVGRGGRAAPRSGARVSQRFGFFS
jgi:hypothetical protein